MRLRLANGFLSVSTPFLLLFAATVATVWNCCYWLISSQHANKFRTGTGASLCRGGSRQGQGGGGGQPATGYKAVNMNKTLGRQFTCVGTASPTHSRWLNTHTHRHADKPTQMKILPHTHAHLHTHTCVEAEIMIINKIC